MDDFLQLYGGTRFDFMDGPQAIADGVSTEQIGHGLSMLCRYAGQCDRFYSVAEHSALMAHTIWFATKDEELARGCLFHDASEAFLPDIPRPLKVHLPDYYDLEARLMEGIVLKYGLKGFSYSYHEATGQRKVVLPQLVGEYDNRILVDEKRAVMSGGDIVWASDCLEPLGVDIRCLSPADAKAFFMQTCEVFSS